MELRSCAGCAPPSGMIFGAIARNLELSAGGSGGAVSLVTLWSNASRLSRAHLWEKREHDVDKPGIEWAGVLSLGEQQRLQFCRLSRRALALAVTFQVSRYGKQLIFWLLTFWLLTVYS